MPSRPSGSEEPGQLNQIASDKDLVGALWKHAEWMIGATVEAQMTNKKTIFPSMFFFPEAYFRSSIFAHFKSTQKQCCRNSPNAELLFRLGFSPAGRWKHDFVLIIIGAKCCATN